MRADLFESIGREFIIHFPSVHAIERARKKTAFTPVNVVFLLSQKVLQDSSLCFIMKLHELENDLIKDSFHRGCSKRLSLNFSECGKFAKVTLWQMLVTFTSGSVGLGNLQSFSRLYRRSIVRPPLILNSLLNYSSRYKQIL